MAGRTRGARVLDLDLVDKTVMGSPLLPAEDRRQLYLGIMSAIVLWTAALALAY